MGRERHSQAVVQRGRLSRALAVLRCCGGVPRPAVPFCGSPATEQREARGRWTSAFFYFFFHAICFDNFVHRSL